MSAGRINEALRFVDSSDRDTWLRMGMAIKSELGEPGRDIWESWSRQADSFNEADAQAVWRSISPDGDIKVGTLFFEAKKNGWKDDGARQMPSPAELAALSRKHAERAANDAKTLERERSTTAAKAREILATSVPAKADHPYLARKQVLPTESLRELDAGAVAEILGYQPKSGGEPLSGRLLVVPVKQGDVLSTLELIDGDKRKTALAGRGTKAGGFWASETLPAGNGNGLTLLLGEGVATMLSTSMATGKPGIAALSSGNLPAVAQTMRTRYPLAKLIILADLVKSTGEPDPHAVEAARSVGGKLAVPDFGEGRDSNMTDFNDVFVAHGAEAVGRAISNASAPAMDEHHDAPAKPEPLLKTVSVGDVLTAPSAPPTFAWHGFLPHGTISLLSAHGGTGKSFMSLMLAVASATGRPLFGVPTTAAPAVFVSLEDSGSIVRHRLAKICNALNIEPTTIQERLHIVDGSESPELFTADHRGAGEITSTYDELAQLVEETRAGLVIVDNASDAFGGDEINRRQVRAFMRALAKIAKDSHCAVLLLAHVDKSTSRNKFGQGDEAYSGSTAWHNSARSRLFMSRDGDSGNLTIQHQKSNLGEIQEPIVIAWPQGGIPALVNEVPDIDGVVGKALERVEDRRIKTLLAMIDEFASRDQFISPAPTAKNNTFAMLRPEPEFKAMKISREDVARLITKCQRDGLIAALDYRTKDRKDRQRWIVTGEGREFAGLSAPSAPSAPSYEESAESAQGAAEGAPSAPSCVGGMGGERARRTWRKT